MSMVGLFIIGALVLAFVFFAITTNNSLVALKNQVNQAWANIDVILKQRFDEIPQLIEIINQFVTHEKNIISNLTNARINYGKAKSIDDKIQASSQLSLALSGVIAIGENYPELKSSENFVKLQERISSLEENLAHRREFYNDAVSTFNTRIEQFPDSFFAKQLGYRQKHFFEVNEFEKVKPSLKINI
jgi:LemA protein